MEELQNGSVIYGLVGRLQAISVLRLENIDLRAIFLLDDLNRIGAEIVSAVGDDFRESTAAAGEELLENDMQKAFGGAAQPMRVQRIAHPRTDDVPLD